ncbi:hypothetical protein GH741_21185 [Aquibacillus halophilus]|uniref:Putative amidase domain-containing protein n=2 Tax=Aquibacillus halophilus TaxID=930132 RepID=A0A6A8DHG8_9BACI|nr:amidase domain-containing protein [Aquibacillus halophilus]MRH45145.1 hypothetical protein [Aquibacillus halophilus]
MQIQKYWIDQLKPNRSPDWPNWVADKKQLHKQRGNSVVRITGKGEIYRSHEAGPHELKVDYKLGVVFFVKKGQSFYHEEEERKHRALFYKGKLIEDEAVEDLFNSEPLPVIESIGEEDKRSVRFEYDRRAAVQYAERWWNDYNPEYRRFDNDCTNYVSQCLRAGGAPMRGAASKSVGWWYQNGQYSYSWAVAHSLRWYLSGSNQGLKGKELESPKELLPGDVICYDFEGDGKWDHNTIVVNKDSDGMPLVNAHTNNSRQRYWSYEDSYAWTSDCKYRFFRIGN